MKFNEDSRVKIPALLHLTRLGYRYQSLRGASWDSSSNIFPAIFKSSLQQINPHATLDEIERVLQEIALLFDNEDLGKAFYERLLSASGLKIIDFEDFDANTFNVVTELPCIKDDEEFRPDISPKTDLGYLRTMAFQRYKRCGPAMRAYHRLRREIDVHEQAPLIWSLYHWLLVPLSLWPVDIAGLADHVLALVSAKKRFDADIILLLETLGTAPVREGCMVMAVHEHAIVKGNYESLVRCQQKFDEREKQLNLSAEFRSSWRKIRRGFDVKKYRLKRGIIRRQMSQERNFRDRLTFSWKSKHGRFRQLFDVLCYRWNLYGMQFSRPLLLKITVNPTPHGTMIFIPRYWSIDLSRDLNWKEIGRLHHAHGAVRQGPKLSPSRTERRVEALKALKAWEAAGKIGIKGDQRHEHVLKELGKSIETDFSTVKRLVREGRTLQ